MIIFLAGKTHGCWLALFWETPISVLLSQRGFQPILGSVVFLLNCAINIHIYIYIYLFIYFLLYMGEISLLCWGAYGCDRWQASWWLLSTRSKTYPTQSLGVCQGQRSVDFWNGERSRDKSLENLIIYLVNGGRLWGWWHGKNLCYLELFDSLL